MGISQDYAILRIRCGNIREVTCDILLSPPISRSPPQCMCPPANAWDVTRVLLSTFLSPVPASWRPLSTLHHSGFRVWPLDTLLECSIHSCFCPLMIKGVGDGHSLAVWPSTDRETCPLHSSVLKILFSDHKTWPAHVLDKPTNPSHPCPQAAGLVDVPDIDPFLLTPLCPPSASLPVEP